MAGIPQPCIRALISHIVDCSEQGNHRWASEKLKIAEKFEPAILRDKKIK